MRIHVRENLISGHGVRDIGNFCGVWFWAGPRSTCEISLNFLAVCAAGVLVPVSRSQHAVSAVWAVDPVTIRSLHCAYTGREGRAVNPDTDRISQANTGKAADLC